MTDFDLLDRKPHLLVVDDDRLILATLVRGLQAAGWHVTCAESAEDALVELDAGLEPDLALLDVQLPGNDGLQLAAQLRDLHDVPFVMFSAYGDETLVAQAAQYGALGYLLKPLDLLHIVPMLQTALARANERSKLHQTRDQLQQALDQRREINVAVGIVMARCKLSKDAAFEKLRSIARSRRMQLGSLASEVIGNSSILCKDSQSTELVS